MRVLIQRVKSANITVNGKNVALIERGLLLFVGIGKDDNVNDIEYLSNKIIKLRIFEDELGKMNLDIKQINGQILSIPQFTLYADTRRGNRPGFEFSASSDKAKDYWNKFNILLRENNITVNEGIFGAHMEVGLINDGPVTIYLNSKEKSAV